MGTAYHLNLYSFQIHYLHQLLQNMAAPSTIINPFLPYNLFIRLYHTAYFPIDYFISIPKGKISFFL